MRLLGIRKAIMLAVALLLFIPPVLLHKEPSASAAAYTMPGTGIKVEIKSVLNERVPEGTRIGAVVRMSNDGKTTARIPDLELRVLTSDGLSYTLVPSVDNDKVVNPKDNTELSYLLVIRRLDDIALSKLRWVKVNEYVYPRTEQTVLTLPISSGIPAKAWTESFVVSSLSASISYTPAGLYIQNSPSGKNHVLTLAAENKGKYKQYVPDFTVEGVANGKAYEGVRLEKSSILLLPGEKKKIHYAIPTESGTDLGSLTLSTDEHFSASAQSRVTYNVARLSIQLPKDAMASSGVETSDYSFNDPIRFDPDNTLIHPDVSVSLVDLRMHSSQGDGYRTLIAKFLLKNQGARGVPVPEFLPLLSSSDGTQYLGSAQPRSAAMLEPNLGYVVSYSFNVPNAETGSGLTMTILDNQTAPPYPIPIAKFKTSAIETQDQALYPFTVKVANWTFARGELKLDLELNRAAGVVVDSNFAKLKIQLIGTSGNVLGSRSIPFIGADGLVNGVQSISFGTADGFDYPASIRLYEAIDTPFGEATRLLAQ